MTAENAPIILGPGDDWLAEIERLVERDCGPAEALVIVEAVADLVRRVRAGEVVPPPSPRTGGTNGRT